LTSNVENEFAGIPDEDRHDSENPLVPGRICGSCMLCCKVLPIAELSKPAGIMCNHAVAGEGCGIRQRRPSACHRFFCGWRLDPNIGPEWKPEICGFVMWISSHYWALMVTVDPDRPLAWKAEPYYSRLREWSARALEENKRIVAMVRGEATIILPDRDVQLGVLGPDDAIVLSRNLNGYHAERRHAPREAPAAAVPAPAGGRLRGPKVGRNDPCPCGSGKKFKQCHGVFNSAHASR
jgi:hypothetical protein